MDGDSFEDRVQIEYPNASTADGEDIEFVAEYRGRNRVLEISFVDPLLPFTALKIDLWEGITAADGVEFAPWSLSFFSAAKPGSTPR